MILFHECEDTPALYVYIPYAIIYRPMLSSSMASTGKLKTPTDMSYQIFWCVHSAA